VYHTVHHLLLSVKIFYLLTTEPLCGKADRHCSGVTTPAPIMNLNAFSD
jgi:hypothetical protein